VDYEKLEGFDPNEFERKLFDVPKIDQIADSIC
jgi:hypothetical protein